MPTTQPSSRPSRTASRGALRLIAAVGLALDAAVHARLAGQYDAVSATVSEGDLFRIEAAAAALAALLVLAAVVNTAARFPAAGNLSGQPPPTA